MTRSTSRLRLAFAVLACSMLFLGTAHADAPMVKTQAPGYYRFMLADFEVTALFDGAIDLHPTKLLTNTTPANVTKMLAHSFEKEPLPTSANRFKPFDGDTEVVPGIKAFMTRGHTPGHSIFVVESQGQKLVLWGDLIHVAAVQFPQPRVTIVFDSDPKAAAVHRREAFADAARKGYIVGAPHLPFPGLGHLRAEGTGYVFFPLDYTPAK
jgi:glyoxylase-like metal-dependent hydrolase (beta-lactamase superfamily II)